jgi:hypothetical protein
VIRCVLGDALIEDAIELQLKSVTAMRNSDETTASKARLNNDRGQVESVDDAENGKKYRQKESKSSRQGCVGYGAVMAMRVFYRKDWIDGRGEVSRRFQSIASDVSRISAAKE